MASFQPKEHALKHAWNYPDAEGIRQPDDRRIAVIGVGRAGNSAVTKLMELGSTPAECIVVNANADLSKTSKAHQKILMGKKLAKGLGVRSESKLCRAAIQEPRKPVEDLLSGIDMVFIAAGLDDGAGTGAASVVAELARRRSIITVGLVTMPFRKEKCREKHVNLALNEMRRQCDTVVVIDSEKLVQLAPQLPMKENLNAADQVLANMIKEIVETISSPSLINLNFADLKTIVSKGGMAVVGVGESDAPNRAEEAVRNALRTPLLEVDYARANGALIHVAGDNHMTVEEVNRVGEIVTGMMDGNARVIWGANVNPSQEGKLRVTLVMTGVNSPPSRNGIGTFAPQLFNLETYAESERPLDVKLNLYQMEP